MVKDRQTKLASEHYSNMRVAEIVPQFTNLGCLIIPFGIQASLLHPMEPTHLLIKDWLEFEWALEPQLFPFMIVFIAALHGCASAACILIIAVLIYMNVTSSVLNDLTPASFEIHSKLRSSINAKFYGK